MLKSWVKIKQSLSLKVLSANILFAFIIVIVIGVIVHNRVSSTFINEKIAISKVETRNALFLAQGHFNIARFQDDSGLNKVVQDFITSSREDGSLSGRETVILPINNCNKSLFYIKCGTGTYIRSLARDIARSLDGFSNVTQLIRTRYGRTELRIVLSI